MAYAYMMGAIERERRMRALRTRRAAIRDHFDPFQIPESEFIKNYRLSPSLYQTLCDELIPLLAPPTRRSAIRPETKILAALRFYATGSYQRPVGKDYDLALSQTAVSTCLEEVTNALNAPEVLLRHIKFPGTREERINIMRRFMEYHHFPGVVGCIDGTHIAIIRPTDNEEVYFNRKHYHSLNSLIICDADLNILHTDSSFGGSNHDSHVWNSNVLQQYLKNLNGAGEACWLLGDSGYAQRPWMMTPILGAAAGSPEDHYTQVQCSARNTVERCIGVLKSRWRCLLAHRTLHYVPVKAGKIANACVVLHNMCNEARLDVRALSEEDRRMDDELQIHVAADDAGAAATVANSRAARQAVVQRLWVDAQRRQ